MDCGYYDLKRKKNISVEEIKKDMAKDGQFEKYSKVHKCDVCENNCWCTRKKKDNKECKEFVLNEEDIFSEVYKRQQNK